VEPTIPSIQGETSLKSRYDIQNDILDIVLKGKSTIDSFTSLRLNSLQEADHFLQSYGYNLENPIERSEVLGNYQEALHFIRKYFLQPENPDGLRLEIPKEISTLENLRYLFLMASRPTSDPKTTYLKNWACSILKVMHTIAQIDKDIRSPYFPDIQKQIFDRFYKVIHRNPEGQLFLGEKKEDPLSVDLVSFETKPKKSRDSIILKLLHKPENVAEDIFDRVGIRFTTLTTFDALRVIKFLKEKMIVIPHNIKPSRSRNTLIEMDPFRHQIEELLTRMDPLEIEEKELLAKLEQAATTPSPISNNPHSSQFYRAIQFTARQLIKLHNPIHDEIKELKEIAKQKSFFRELSPILERIDLKCIQRDIRFFYPFEVQIVDHKSAQENEKGKSAHSQYKHAQVMTALERVMGGLRDFMN
jgi:uncharacterized protein (TIGR04562 family)